MSRMQGYNREYMREYRAKVTSSKLRNLPFVGVDGEGGNAPDPNSLFGTCHNYYLLRAGDQCLKADTPLTSYQCLNFLADLPKDCIHIGYFFDYDSTMILRGLPQNKTGRIATVGVGITKVREDFDIGYLPHKELRVRRAARGDAEPGPFTVINDMGTFFQCSFVKALEDWGIGTEWERHQIEAGKGQRAEFGVVNQDIDEYNALEIRLLQELAEEYRAACIAAGYVPVKWQGPGNLATAMLKAHDAPKTKDIKIFDNRMFRRLANEAYYGGRFEAAYVGPVKGPVYEYDINSAYPHAMRSLPCLTCGTWVRRRDRPRSGALWFGRVDFDHDPMGPRICNLPVRDKEGGIFFPRSGRGVYWSVEIEAAQRAGTKTSYISGYEYVPGKTCECKPFDWIEPLYEYRKSLGKDGKGKVIKLGMNSIYGKKAQSVGRPAYANAVEAGLITALTRAMIIDAYNGNQNAVVMVATDAVYSLVPLDLPTGSDKRLGEWDSKVHADGLFIVQSGVYFSGADARNKTRGIPESLFSPKRDEFERAFAWLTYGFEDTEYVEVQTRLFLNLKQAAAWNRLDLAGQWFECPQGADHNKRGTRPKLCTCRKVLFNWAKKRHGMLYRRGEYFVTVPKYGFYESVPYDKVIGGVPQEVREFRELRQGQPDWNLEVTPTFDADGDAGDGTLF